ncbi:hypothetical protein [Streptomyces sp. CBMA123]|uniref:hypothetical protein n=1 Tax=Streptomyces sp. CBMA123 TaxID=1896313 RepID=UPI001661F77A|nr:hypothetical protein [Streptomyces sp. CBMA123]MBD0688503.1 hypothetical protein [Streptomyces sp. CBMA123]
MSTVLQQRHPGRSLHRQPRSADPAYYVDTGGAEGPVIIVFDDSRASRRSSLLAQLAASQRRRRRRVGR